MKTYEICRGPMKRNLPRINAATRYAVWWAVLAVVVMLPVVESGMVLAAAVEFANFVPKIEISEPGAMACPGTKLAPFTTPPTVG